MSDNNNNAANTAVAKIEEEIIPDVIEDRRKDTDGKVVINKYLRGRMLGKGGFAKVFLGSLVPSNTQYALKIVAKSSLIKHRAKHKLQSEIKIHRTLRHVNIVKFERFFEDSTNAYMILELCHNNSMSELMKRRKTLSEPETRFYISQLVSALHYLHHNLIIHRDLKLGNLFIDAELKIKVGDFGLASKLSHQDEKRRTVCGTPNYIAPEILAGKEGHSFEVDIWAIGVIIYTVLVGKPPFESKDVKSTYKRILANSYSYPDNMVVCPHAKSLIGLILQTRPESRPSLDQIMQHTFFTRSTAYTPAVLHPSCLKTCPTFPAIDILQATNNPLQQAPRINNINIDHYNYGNNDENDPAAANRVANASVNGLLVGKGSSALDKSNPAKKMVDNFVDNKDSKDNHTSTSTAGLRARNNAATASVSSTNPPSVTTRVQTRSSTVSTENMTSSTTTATATTSYSSHGLKPSSTKPINNNYSSVNDRGYSKKFDIFVDSKPNTAPVVSNSITTGPHKRDANSADVLKQLSAKRSVASVHTNPMPISHTTVHPQYEMEVEQMQTDLEQVTLQEKNNQINTSRNLTKPLSNTPTISSSSTRNGKSLKDIQEAWNWDDQKDVFPSSVRVQSSSANTTRVAILKTPATTHHLAESKANDANSNHHSNPSAMIVCTPPEQIISSKEIMKHPLGTLETMHDMLNNSFSIVDREGLVLNANNNKVETNYESLSSNAKLVANVWVVRYVDYTSKYGLGFLFNTGSAGVYFNDSTKIILSADGSTFQYIERKRVNNNQAQHNNNSENSCQTHLITRYPVELQKKVLLLKHFRNYLVDQQKNSPDQQSGVTNGDGLAVDMNLGLIQQDGNDRSIGACSSVRFGMSSVKYNPSADATDFGNTNNWLTNNDEVEMPYLKKWVRTKHAILFRISNRTVQVVFYDRSEVLLSSEARVITYVNKHSARSEHSLDEVLGTGRLDIAKRLKYTKDIMYRLINTQR
eukprot:gene7940-10774_t